MTGGDLSCQLPFTSKVRNSYQKIRMIGLLTSTLIPTISAKRHVVEPIPQWELLIMISVIVGLVLVGGLVAGLTIGLMSLDSTNIAILKESGTPSEQKCAKKIEPLRRNGHLLLVTFLLVNTIVNETLPIMFDAINFTGAWAVLMSTCLIVIFGEIIPQAVCAKYGLQIGAFFAGPVKILIYMFYIVAWPIASLLDYFLGHKAGNIYRHAGLKELVAIHGEDNQGPLSKDEVSVLRAVLDLRSKTAKDIMTSLENVFMLSIEDKLDRETIVSLLQAGFSRVPVYLKTRQDILGCVLTKQFILNDPDAATPVSALKLRKLPLVRDDTPLFELLHIFEAGGTHMALIVTENLDNKQAPFGDVINTNGLNWSLRHPRKATKTSYEIIGIATMEDVLEELIGHEVLLFLIRLLTKLTFMWTIEPIHA